MPKYKVKARYIREQRIIVRKSVEDKLQKMVEVKENYKGTYSRLRFLNKFSLYSGLPKYAE
jgi:hypothetical protein